jgi:hypothetical protein
MSKGDYDDTVASLSRFSVWEARFRIFKNQNFITLKISSYKQEGGIRNFPPSLVLLASIIKG